QEWTVDPRTGPARAAAPTVTRGEGEARVSGELAFVPDAPGADLFVGVALPAPTPQGLVAQPVGVAIEAGAAGVELTPVMRYYAGWARGGAPSEFPLAASAARSVAGRALDTAARTMISVHGGIGATWEHDAPLYFRRAQLTRRLLGGTASATDRVAGELMR